YLADPAPVARTALPLHDALPIFHHFRGSTALAYEADVVLVLNDKLSVVSKVHLAYDTTRHDEFRDHVVFSVEKHRNGTAGVDLEDRKSTRLNSSHVKISYAVLCL